MKRAFISEFIKERKMVGAIAPSSKFLMRKMLKKIDFSKDLNIVELGPGTGIFTSEILKRMTPNSNLFSFELNTNFYDQLTSKFNDSRIRIINDSAEKMGEYLSKDKIDKADVVISSLPLAVIPEKIKENILNSAVEILTQDGAYIQFQYSLNAKKILQSKFDKIDIQFTPLNLPPAFVYHCSN